MGQSNWNQFGRMLTRGAGKALLTMPEFMGYIGDFLTVNEANDYDNSLSRWVREQKVS